MDTRRAERTRREENFQLGARPEVAGYGGWFDFNNAINAVKRKDDKYLVFAEDDGAQKVNLFHWRPETS